MNLYDACKQEVVGPINKLVKRGHYKWHNAIIGASKSSSVEIFKSVNSKIKDQLSKNKWEQLLYNAMYNDCEPMIKYIKRYHKCLELTNYILLACHKGHIETLEYHLLNYNTYGDIFWGNILINAYRDNCNDKIIKLLESKYFNTHSHSPSTYLSQVKYMSKFYYLCKENDIPLIKDYISAYYSEINFISYATMAGNLDIVKFLLNEYYDISILYINSSYILACEKGHFHIIKFFLKNKHVRSYYDNDLYYIRAGLSAALRYELHHVAKYLVKKAKFYDKYITNKLWLLDNNNLRYNVLYVPLNRDILFMLKKR